MPSSFHALPQPHLDHISSAHIDGYFTSMPFVVVVVASSWAFDETTEKLQVNSCKSAEHLRICKAAKEKTRARAHRAAAEACSALHRLPRFEARLQGLKLHTLGVLVETGHWKRVIACGEGGSDSTAIAWGNNGWGRRYCSHLPTCIYLMDMKVWSKSARPTRESFFFSSSSSGSLSVSLGVKIVRFGLLGFRQSGRAN